MILVGDCRERLRELDAGSVQCVVTSPPYFGLRSYSGGAAEIGTEPTPEEFVAALVDVFREVRRVLRDDGTAWINLGDSYNADGRKGRAHMGQGKNSGYSAWVNKTMEGTKPKDLLGVPWLVAFALRADGWYLRSEIILAKRNPMPESVTDRPTKAHEQFFLLSKQPRYFYDADAIREDATHEGKTVTLGPKSFSKGQAAGAGIAASGNGIEESYTVPAGRNKRSVWEVSSEPFAGAHFAVFGTKWIEPCILAGSPPKCCGECGAPWRRVVKREVGERTTETVPSRIAIGHDPIPRPRSSHPPGWRSMAPDAEVDLGWLATCDHDDDTGRSVVLDPFAGAGTVGVVCGWHGRDFLGVELNPEYAAMAEQRIALEGRPGGKPQAHERPNIHEDQLGFEVAS